MLDQFQSARRVSAPLIGINTPDPAQTVKEIAVAVIAAGEKSDPPSRPVVIEWDYIRGLRGRDEMSQGFVASLGEFDPTLNNPVGALMVAAQFPPKAVLFIHLANRWIGEPAFVQGVWNLRDAFKSDQRTLVLLAKSLPVPAELSDDLLVIDEPLPDETALIDIVHQTHKNAAVEPKKGVTTAAVEALRGLSAFAAEQITAMSLKKSGLDVGACWERKRKQIEQTPGLKVFRDGETFKQIGGLQQVKDYMAALLAGRNHPNAITWLDELDKAMPGGSQDTSGVSQDQLGTILSYMEDHAVIGVMCVGAPGTGKSAIAKAAGNSIGVPTVRFDLGSCKGSLVGQSEEQIRNALRVISAVSNDRAMFVATANSISGMDSALKRRFPFVFFFDLPTPEEKAVIWNLWIGKYELPAQPLPDDAGWSGANIQKCCECAWRLNRPLIDCGRFIVPCAKASRKELEQLRTQADRTFLSASDDGVYVMNREPAPTGNRTISLE